MTPEKVVFDGGQQAVFPHHAQNALTIYLLLLYSISLPTPSLHQRTASAPGAHPTQLPFHWSVPAWQSSATDGGDAAWNICSGQVFYPDRRLDHDESWKLA